MDHIQPTTSTSRGETSEAIKGVNDENLDEAARYLATTEEYGPMTPEKEKKIVKKIDAWMIPIVSNCETLRDVFDRRTDLSLLTTASFRRNSCGRRQGSDRYCFTIWFPDGQWHGRTRVQLARKHPTTRGQSLLCRSQQYLSLTFQVDISWACSCIISGPAHPTSSAPMHRVAHVVYPDYLLCGVQIMVRFHGAPILARISRSRHHPVLDHDCRLVLQER